MKKKVQFVFVKLSADVLGNAGGSCLGGAAVDPVGVGVGREAAGRVLVRGDVQRVPLADSARRQRLSSDGREGGQRRSVGLEGPTQWRLFLVFLIFPLVHQQKHRLAEFSYPVIVGGVSQREALHLQDEHGVVELDEVASLLLS